MRTLSTLLSMIFVAALIGSVAILSIQNIEIVSIKFLLWESVRLPFGVLLAFAVGFGLIVGSFVPVGQKR
ncbi:MAG: lipopolysaccharide assembly protein LapA domain-containing protein [Limnothrix sp.]